MNFLEDAFVVDADFEIALTHTLEDVLSKGVPLYFRFEFELIRPRCKWLNNASHSCSRNIDFRSTR